MKCPYNNKIECTYLDEFTETSRSYHCSECPYYAPVPEEDTNSIIKGILLILAIIIGVIAIAEGIIYLTH